MGRARGRGLPARGIAALALAPVAGPSRDAVASLDGAGPLVLSTAACRRSRRPASTCRRLDRSAQPAVRAAVPAVDRRRRRSAAGSACPGRDDRRVRRRRVALPAGHDVLEGVRLGGPQGRDAHDPPRPRRRVVVRDATCGTRSRRDAVLAPAEGVPGAFALPASVAGPRGGGTRSRASPTASPATARRRRSCSASTRCSSRTIAIPLAPHAEPLPPGAVTLRSLVAAGRLVPRAAGARRLAAAHPGSDPAERAALGYLSANCGGCHNDRGPLARLGFSFKHEGRARRTPDRAGSRRRSRRTGASSCPAWRPRART